MLLFMSPANEEAGNGCTFEDWIRYDREMKDAGVWVSGHPLQDLTTCTTVQVGPDGDRTITDGPFAETREVLGGYDIAPLRRSRPGRGGRLRGDRGGAGALADRRRSEPAGRVAAHHGPLAPGRTARWSSSTTRTADAGTTR
ncbi:YciI family protein [Micromonospora luteifusca]